MTTLNPKVIEGTSLITSTNTVILDGTNESIVNKIKTINLFNKKTVKTGGYYNQNGTWTNDSNCNSSELIEVEPSTVYTWISGNASSWSKCYYDESKNAIGDKIWDSKFTTPSNCKYVTVTASNDSLNTSMLIKGTDKPIIYIPYSYDYLNLNLKAKPKSKLQGLTWNCLGDSYTHGYGEIPYLVHVAELLEIGEVNNYGISGTTIGGTDTNAFCNRYSLMKDNADIITVLGGINDINGSVVLGSMSDRTNSTFYGSLHVLIQGLYNKYPGKKIGFITFPKIPKWEADYERSNNFVNAILEVCEYYGLPCLDLYRKSGLCPKVVTSQQVYYKDDTHLTTEGQKIFLRDKIANFIESL